MTWKIDLITRSMVHEGTGYNITARELGNGTDWLMHFREKRWFVEQDFVSTATTLLDIHRTHTESQFRDAYQQADPDIVARFQAYEWAANRWMQASMASEFDSDLINAEEVNRVVAIEKRATSGETHPLLELIRLHLAYENAIDTHAQMERWAYECEVPF